MTQDLYRCSCGKGFKTAQGLAGHKRFCQEGVRPPKPEQHVEELLSRFSKLEQNYRELSRQHEGSLKRLDDLNGKVNLLINYVCQGGINLVGVHSSRIIELTGQLYDLKSEMKTSQEKFEREIKGWVWQVIPEQFRPPFIGPGDK